MSIIVAILAEIILVLLLALRMLYVRYRSQRETLFSYLETEKLPPPKPKISSKKKKKFIGEHLQKEVERCEERFEASPAKADTDPTKANTEIDKDVHLVSIRHALLTAEISALEQKLSPADDPNSYWEHFSTHLMPLIECFDTLTENALEKRDEEWKEKFALLEQHITSAEESLAKLTADHQQAESEKISLENDKISLEKKMDEYLSTQSMIAELEKERESLNSILDSPMDDMLDGTGESNSQNQTTHDVEIKRLKDRSLRQQSIIDNLLNKIDQYQTTQEAGRANGPVELTDEDIQQLQALKEEAEQLNKMIKESEIIIHMLEGEIQELTQQLAETNDRLTQSNIELIEAKEVAENSVATEALEAELEQAQEMQMTLIRSNSDYAAIIHFVRQSLEAHNLQKMADELLQILDLFNVQGAVQIYSQEMSITRETKDVNSMMVNECFTTVHDKNGFIEKGGATLWCYPNIKILMENIQQLAADDRDRLKETIPVITSLADEFIANINNEKEVELNRAKLKQTIIAVHQSARNLDIRLKLFFKESAQESDAMFKKLRNASYRFKLDQRDRENLLSSMNDSIRNSERILEKYRGNTLVKQLLQSVEPVLNEMRAKNAETSKKLKSR